MMKICVVLHKQPLEQPDGELSPALDAEHPECERNIPLPVWDVAHVIIVNGDFPRRDD